MKVGPRFFVPQRFSAVVLVLAGLSLGCANADAPADTTTAHAGEPPAVADWAPPGPGFVVWESNRTGAWRLWIRELDGSGLRQLTPDEGRRAHCCPHVRPDGSGIAYLSLEPGPETYRDGPENGELRLIGPDGSGTRVLTETARSYGEHRAGIWHDDEHFVFLDGDGVTVRLDVENGTKEPLTTTGHERTGWLPNRGLTHATTGVPTFSPFVAGRGATELQMLSGCQPYFTPDGRWGYWTAGAGGPIDKMELAGRTVTEVLGKNDPRIPGNQGYLYFPMLSPDRRLMAFAASAGEHNHFTADYDVYVVEMDPERFEIGGVPVRMTEDPKTDRFPDVFLARLPLGLHDGEAPLTVRFDTPDGGRWTWDFGDGGSGTAPEHRYEEPGAYAVTATSGETVLDGRVRVRPARPPELVAAQLREGRRVVLRFDEPVDPETARLTLASGGGIAGRALADDARSLVVDLAAAVDGADILTVAGLRDRASLPNVAPTFEVELAADEWPSSREGLVFVWKSSEALNLVTDPSTGVDRSFRVDRKGLVRLDHDFRADLGDGALVASEEAGRFVVEQLRGSNELTLELTIQPRRRQDAAIAALSAGMRKRRNLVLAQRGDELELTLLTSGWGAVENRVVLGRLTPGKSSHVVVSYRPGRLRSWLDGEAGEPQGDVQGDFFQWKAVPLRFGNEAGGDATWHGTVEGVAVYSRALEEDEARENARRFAAIEAGRPKVERRRLRGRLIARSKLPSLDEITPYREALAVFEYAGPARQASRFRVAHWVLLDGEPTPDSRAREGDVVDLVVEPFAANPQLEGAVLSDTLEASAADLLFAVR